VIIAPGFRDTDDDPSGFFSGWNPEDRAYGLDTWSYDKAGGEATAGRSEQEADVSGEQAHGAHGMSLPGGEPPELDNTMQHEQCVLQLVRRHFARYTPELVQETCGCSREEFLAVAAALCENSGRERTSSIVYAVGWTQHTVGVQNIRAASIIQLLLGNIGRPGGASSRSAGTRTSRARRTSRRCTTSSRGTSRCPIRSRTRRSTRLSS